MKSQIHEREVLVQVGPSLEAARSNLFLSQICHNSTTLPRINLHEDGILYLTFRKSCARRRAHDGPVYWTGHISHFFSQLC